MRKLVVILAVAMALAVGGCGKSSEEKAMEQAIEKGSGGKADVDLSKQKMTFQTKEGEKIEIATGGEGIKLPDDFPKDILVYAGTKVESAVKTGDAHQLGLSTPDAPEKVAEAYAAQMKKDGWAEESSMKTPEMTMLQYTKEKRSVMVHITKDGDAGTKIMLMAATEKD